MEWSVREEGGGEGVVGGRGEGEEGKGEEMLILTDNGKERRGEEIQVGRKVDKMIRVWNEIKKKLVESEEKRGCPIL